MKGMTEYAIRRDIPIYKEAMPEYLESEIGQIRVRRSSILKLNKVNSGSQRDLLSALLKKHEAGPDIQESDRETDSS